MIQVKIFYVQAWIWSVVSEPGVFVDVRNGPKASAALRVLPHALNRRKDLVGYPWALPSLLTDQISLTITQAPLRPEIINE